MRELTDLDFAAYSGQSEETVRLFQDYEYSLDKHHAALHAGRHVFYRSTPNLRVDIFYDKLEMCHTISFKDRLEIDFPTIPLADMLLEKMQIVRINEKDIKDMIVLLREHEVQDSDNNVINGKYVARLLSDQWGFWYTVMTNLSKLQASLTRFLDESGRSNVGSKIETLTSMIEREPKNFRWRMRAKVGTRKKWYEDVEEVHLRRQRFAS